MILEFVIVNALLAISVLLMPLTVAWQGRKGATPSRWAGLRTEQTRVNAETWQAGHRAALPAVRIGSLVSFIIALGGIAAAVQGWQGMTMFAALGSGAVLLIVSGIGIARANKAAEAALHTD